MLAAFQRKTKFSKSKPKDAEKRVQGQKSAQSVKFQSDYPTEIWEKSRSPSPASPRSHHAKSRTFKMENFSTDSSDSSSTSSLDEIVYVEQEKRKKKTKRYPGNMSSSSSDHSSDCSSLDWPLDETTKRKERPRHQPQPPQTLRYPPNIHVPQEQPHLVCVTANYFPSVEWQAQYQVMPVNCGEYVYVDKQPPRTDDDLNRGAASWVLVRKLEANLILGPPGFIPRHLTRIPDPQEVFNIVQSYTTNSNIMNRSSNNQIIHPSSTNEYTHHQKPQETSFEPTWAKKLGTNLPYNPNFDLASSHHSNRISSGVYSLEHEDKDSGRGPSSGSEWSASKYGSFGGLDEHELDGEHDAFSERSRIEDPGIEVKPQRPPTQSNSQESSESSPPNLPPPMKPLSCDITPKLIEKLNCIYIGDSRVQFATPLILRNNTKFAHNHQGSEKKTTSINWEPYKTITQKEENKLETFTRV